MASTSGTPESKLCVESFAHKSSRKELPEAFREFLRKNGIDEAVYDIAPSSLPRFIRCVFVLPRKGCVVSHVIFDVYYSVNPFAKDIPSTASLATELGCAVSPVSWLPGFFAVDGTARLARCPAYTSGKVYGVDAASGAAVAALDVQPGHDVLDICCAPGAKLAMLADHMKRTGTLTGVDLSAVRVSQAHG